MYSSKVYIVAASGQYGLHAMIIIMLPLECEFSVKRLNMLQNYT